MQHSTKKQKKTTTRKQKKTTRKQKNNYKKTKNIMINKSRPLASPPLVLLFSRLPRDLAASDLLLLPSAERDHDDDYYYF